MNRCFRNSRITKEAVVDGINLILLCSGLFNEYSFQNILYKPNCSLALVRHDSPTLDLHFSLCTVEMH